MKLTCRKLSVGAALAALAMAVTLASAQKPAPFTLAISAPNSSVLAGRGLEISVTLTNHSDATVITPPTLRKGDRAEFLYRLHITGPDGKPPPHTALTRWDHVGSSSVSSVRVPPGDSFRVGILVSKYFDVTVPGGYSMKVCADWERGTPVGVQGKTNMGAATRGERQRFIGVYPRVCSNTIIVTVTL